MLSWLVLELTDSVAAVAALGAARGLPMLLFAYAGGSLADRVEHLKLLRITQGTSLAIVGAYAIFLAAIEPAAWTAHLVIGLSGILWCVDFTNRRSLYTELFESGELATALPVDTITFTVGLTIGPLIGGFLTLAGGFAVAYAGLAVIHAASLVLLPANRRPKRHPAPATANPLSITERVLAALTALRGQRGLQATLCVTLVANFFAFPFHQMIPVISRDMLAANALQFGILVAAWGAGALAGSFALSMHATRRPGWIFAAGTSTVFVCVGGFALSDTYLLSVGLLLAGGAGFSGFATMQILLTLRTAAPERRGRSLGIIGLAIGTQPLGIISLGLIAERVGPQAALAGFSLVGLCSMVLIRWRYPELSRRPELSDQPDERMSPGR